MRVRWELGNFSRHPASFSSLECNTNLNSSYPQCGRVDNFKPRDPVLSFSHWHARLPGLFLDLGHEPVWDDKLQNIVMMNWKRRQECRGPEGCRWEAVASSTGIWRRRCRKRLRLRRRRKRNRKKKEEGEKKKKYSSQISSSETLSIFLASRLNTHQERKQGTVRASETAHVFPALDIITLNHLLST